MAMLPGITPVDRRLIGTTTPILWWMLPQIANNYQSCIFVLLPMERVSKFIMMINCICQATRQPLHWPRNLPCNRFYNATLILLYLHTLLIIKIPNVFTNCFDVSQAVIQLSCSLVVTLPTTDIPLSCW